MLPVPSKAPRTLRWMLKAWSIIAKSCSRSLMKASKYSLNQEKCFRNLQEQLTNNISLQGQTNIHLSIRHHYEPLHGQAECLQEQASWKVSYASLPKINTIKPVLANELTTQSQAQVSLCKNIQQEPRCRKHIRREEGNPQQ